MNLASLFVVIETIALLLVFTILYYIIAKHYFEYKYVWQHSDKALPPRYLLSCFWEGQEGSFLLWAFWNTVLGWLIFFRERAWRNGVCTVIQFAQFCLFSMLLGVHLGNLTIGSNPFILLRDSGFLDNAPFFHDVVTNQIRADYLSFIKDGSGLNTLLQNYWMIIHPPILFLGFASTILPFSFAVTGLYQKNHNWVKPALPYTLFSVAVLGLGIMMGAMWAYESLSFGGYWAWDPVENASLVPWIILVAGLHTLLIKKHTPHALRSCYFFSLLAFCLVLYSTFLTRSGILGDTSVHAFTDLGLNGQLIAFVLIFTIPAGTLYYFRYKYIATWRIEENTSSREFWLLLGSLILFLSAIIIIVLTSLPVFNKILDSLPYCKNVSRFAPPEDVPFAYNRIQILIAIMIGLLTGCVQYLKYKTTTWSYFWRNMKLPMMISLFACLLLLVFHPVQYDNKGVFFLVTIYLALFASIFALIGNFGYIILVLRTKLANAGGSIAHIGFALILVGILLSSGGRKILSWNPTHLSMFQGSQTENPAENITLLKGVPVQMGNYQVTYLNDSFHVHDNKTYYQIMFVDTLTHRQFSLYPNTIKNNKGGQGYSANPDAQHFLTKDIFVYITSFFFNAQDNQDHGFTNKQAKISDTLYYSRGFFVLKSIAINPPSKKQWYNKNTIGVFLNIEVTNYKNEHFMMTPGITINSKEIFFHPDTLASENLVINFNKVLDEQKGDLEVGIQELTSPQKIITLKVILFPYILLLWLGVLILLIGCFVSIRVKVLKK